MDMVISYSDLVVLNGDFERNVAKLMDHGAESIEILMDGPKWDVGNEPYAAQSATLNRADLDYSIHPPVWDTNLTSENSAIRELSFLQYKKSIVFGADVGASYIVIHPGFLNAPVFSRETARKRAAEAVDRLNGIARPLGVRLAVENVGYQGTALFSMNEFAHFLDGMDDNIGYLIDTGHAFIDRWDIPQLIPTIKNRLFALHLHDNSGLFDQHKAIGEGNISWGPIWSSLKNTAMDFRMVLEYDTGISLEKMRSDKDMLLKELSATAP
jgi:sugar phosphate isomerase/epimerase